MTVSNLLCLDPELLVVQPQAEGEILSKFYQSDLNLSPELSFPTCERLKLVCGCVQLCVHNLITLTVTSDNSRVYEHNKLSLWKHEHSIQASHFNSRPTRERKCVMMVSGTCGSLPLSSCNPSYEAWPAIGSCRSSTVSGPPSRGLRGALFVYFSVFCTNVTCDQLTRHCDVRVRGIPTSMPLRLCTYSSDGCKVADGQWQHLTPLLLR